MAYYGSLGDIDVGAIDKSIADTAVDVFVYDTRKDSDGGAWRKRTQHTSWYNEAATQYRGSRKEFPAVAVIVAESNQVTIYDGDDPDMPMWMVFQARSDGSTENGQSFVSAYTTPSSVVMLNGIIYLGHTHSGDYWRIGLTSANFIKDSIFSNTRYGDFKFNIAKRNSNSTAKWMYNVGNAQIVNNIVNDVAMTVLPNAPIDPSTGLPIPTIAVATDGGVSVIKDDGTVANMQRGPNETGTIAFDKNNDLIFSWGTTDDGHRHITRLSESLWYTYNNSSIWTNNYLVSSAAGGVTGVTLIGNSGRQFGIDYDAAVGGNIDDRLLLVEPLNRENIQNTNLSSFITTSYNSGWMHGAIKGAFLSDTDDTDVTGTELVTNGTFDSDVSGWGSYNSTISYDSSDNSAKKTGGGAYNRLYQTISGLVVGKSYVISFKAKANTNYHISGESKILSGTVTSYGSANWTNSATTIPVTDGKDISGGYEYFSGRFTAVDTTMTWAVVTDFASGSTFNLDDVSMRVAEEDRSVNNNGLQVFGTITKTPVATGADLVAYSGFSGSNYLQQPYNSDLDFGTGDFSIMSWIKTTRTSGYGDVVHRSDTGSTGYASMSEGSWFWQIFPNRTYGFYFRTAGGASTGISVSTALVSGVWTHVTIVRISGILRFYHNGVLVNTTGPASNISASWSDSTSSMTLKMGWQGSSYNYPATQETLSLVRISKSAPSAEQIKKIYEDEKVLFQEGAQCTLYGSSDAVTALAYDETTNLLHVGTASGRSDFSGLKRINNTTTAVTTAISASNGLVAEQ